ncbi:Armadillo repeat-containing protein 7 [Choanephora cucurbitarum]|uniref:Armadillo repeat-containing protein 7 n=1 Tax=Choanephora cucurbitarum TaxID=101091 RepID=A0A1C7NJC3_9FUNG|nr:Armadillo repeat-containing protein 7 [Choanephora cucurbitarum]
MFQSKKYIEQRHGKESANREDHLKLLVQEYQVTQSQEAKQQILANLANFAYDPINYNTLWDLQVIQLFLDALEEHDGLLQEFGIGGIANICLAFIQTQHGWLPKGHLYLKHTDERNDRIDATSDTRQLYDLIDIRTKGPSETDSDWSL